MTIASEVITRALNLLGAHSRINEAPGEVFNEGVKELAKMADEFAVEDFRVGLIAPEDLNDDLGEIRGSVSAIEYMLMFRLAPIIQKGVPESARIAAQRSIRLARERWLHIEPDPRPIIEVTGQGNVRASDLEF